MSRKYQKSATLLSCNADGDREGGVEHEGGVTVEVVAGGEGLLNSLEGTIIDAILQFMYNLFIIFVT